MGKIFGIGETVLDIIFKDGDPQASKPGGSVLNSMVSMGRIGLPVSFISEYGQDDVGDVIDKFLNANGVNTSLVHRFKDKNTSLAIAFLDEKNEAHYTFYKDLSAERLNSDLPLTEKDDYIQYGSFYAILPSIRKKIVNFISKAKKNGSLILYDPNFRRVHIHELERLKPYIVENMEMSSLVRASDEDFINIFGVHDADHAWEAVKNYCSCLVYTANTKGVYVRSSSFSCKFPVNEINPLSTIGAGDNFNEGMLSSLFYRKITPDQLNSLGEEEWREIISVAVDFATDTCLSYDNYISHSFAEKFLSIRKDTDY
jgi:fructokinase